MNDSQWKGLQKNVHVRVWQIFNLYVSEGLAQELFCGALEISEKDVEEWCLMQCSSFFYAGQREARQPVNR